MIRLLRFLFVLVAMAATATSALAQPVVSAVRTGIHEGGRTRLVLDLTESVEFSVFTLADPYRVVVDLPEVGWAPGITQGRSHGLIAGMRFGLFAPGNSRVVLDMTGPVSVKRTMLLPPTATDRYRLVLDLVETDRDSFLAAIRPPVRRAGMPMVPATKPERPAERIVVIDPGHGGVDPGAISIAGNYEKDLVLDYARELKRRIEAEGGFKVLLTRDRDIYIALADRVRFAREAGAALFISLHADSIDDRSIRGGAVYTLSETASDRETAALAAKENKSDIVAGIDLEIEDQEVASILFDLVQRETMNYSARFANVVVEELTAQELRMRTRPHRFAGFRVLKAPDVPSVLVELGFLSNRAEERYLHSDEGRAAITSALADVVLRYFAEIKA